MTKKLYAYHPETLEFVAEIEAQKDPLESIKQGKDCWLKPAFTTETKPLNPGKNQSVIYKDGRWEKVDDFRGQTYFDQDGNSYTITKLGFKPEKDWIDSVDKIKEKEVPWHIKRQRAIIEKFSITDQLDAILKGFNQLRLNGTDLPEDLDKLVGHWLNVKKTIPKEDK